ncbi:hypothetical protein PF004_g29575 [Phytophthora fragariae]|uniref:Uncharacterized protein n=1 Tax=Phytophthora fragariae TaxID=53985 RepID=A0A6G0MF52_9STRA|nr:hypothetical protein PF004_g29575 [Phytophthora fragariae]
MHQDDSPEGVTTPSDAHQPGGAPPSVDDGHVEEGNDSGYVDGDTPQGRDAADLGARNTEVSPPVVEVTGETWGDKVRANTSTPRLPPTAGQHAVNGRTRKPTCGAWRRNRPWRTATARSARGQL